MSSPKMCSKKFPFSSSERELVVALVRERPIIEDKRTHAQNIDLKKKAWDDLTIAFNSQPYVTPRNNVQLKRCWENIKTQRKKELSQESISMRLTGGGPPEGGSITDNVVDAICPYINLTVPGVIDSNSIEISDDLKPYKVDQKNKETPNDVLDLVLTKHKLVDGSLNRKIVKNLFDSENCAEVINVDTNFVSEVDENIPPKPKKRKEIPTTSTVINVDTNFLSEIDENIPSKLKKRKEIPATSSGFKKETEARIKRSTMNMQYDSELHELRLKRERVLIKREENLMEYEKQLHALQLEKLKLEIELLTKHVKN